MSITLGTFKIAKVIDGDTIEVNAPPLPKLTQRKTLRFHNIDTEETYKPKDLGPVTEYGKEVTRLAEKWYAERGNEAILKSEDDPAITDFYDRPLVQVFAGKDHYQQYAIANGWTPYYQKYGFSEEYHTIFVEAEKKAMKDKLGIWSDKLQRRSDKEGRPYPLLQQWWQMRAEQIQMAKEFKKKGQLHMLLNGKNYEAAFEQARQGKTGQVFGEIVRNSNPALSGSGLFMMAVKLDVPFYVYVATDAKNRPQIIESIEKTFISRLDNLPASLLKPNFAFVRGKLTVYSRYGHQIPEIVIQSSDQISKSPFASL